MAELLSVNTLSSDIINWHGTEAQKEKYLARACSGQVGAFALTEPGAGSDAAAAKTRAVSDGDDYVINGTKCFISNMGKDEGDYVILIALTDPEKKTRGMSAIIVDRGTPGGMQLIILFPVVVKTHIGINTEPTTNPDRFFCLFNVSNKPTH